MAELIMFNCEVDNAVYYLVAAERESDCERLIRECEGEGDDGSAWTSFTAKPMPASRLDERKLKSDETGEMLTYREALAGCTGPSVVGCSEW